MLILTPNAFILDAHVCVEGVNKALCNFKSNKILPGLFEESIKVM